MGKLVHRVPSRYCAVPGQLLRAQTPEHARVLENSNIIVRTLEDPDGSPTITELEALVGRHNLFYDAASPKSVLFPTRRMPREDRGSQCLLQQPVQSSFQVKLSR